jgi:hypothetical protein
VIDEAQTENLYEKDSRSSALTVDGIAVRSVQPCARGTTSTAGNRNEDQNERSEGKIRTKDRNKEVCLWLRMRFPPVN